jgi:transposase
MKRKKHTPDQIIAKLRQAEAERAQGASVEVVCRKLEISTQTYMRWQQQYAGMQVDQVKRLRELEHENTRLKKLVAEQAMDIAALKEISRKKW